MEYCSKTLASVIFFMAVLGFWGNENAFGSDADHLLISEVVVKTRDPLDRFGSPYIQIVNPTNTDLDMGQVYLSDGTTYPVAFYYYLALGDPEANNPGGGSGGDFNARFPEGYVLAAGDSLAVSINGSTEYEMAYGRLPDFELFEDALTPDTVPELLEVFPGSINAGPFGGDNVPSFSDIAESIILYTWDQSSDLVQDLDYLMWGTNEGVRFDKTGVTIGGSTFAADTPVSNQEPTAVAGASFGYVFRRISADEGTEILTGGNGLTGHDETSENLASTWQEVNVVTHGHGVPSAPGFLHPAAPIFFSSHTAPSMPYEGQDTHLFVQVVSHSAISSITFHYSVDGASFVDLIGTWISDGEYSAIVPAQVEGAFASWYCTAENEDGGVSIRPVEAPLYLNHWTVDEAPDPSLFPTKLLITEICSQAIDGEFIEIHNPSGHDVDMSNFYLGDAVFYDQGYWNIGAGASPATTGGGIYNDFQARFPHGYMLASGDTIVVSVGGSLGFSYSYGFLPDLELFEDDFFPDLVPNMRPIFETADGNSIITIEGANPSTPLLTNSGESVVLYHWVEGDDLVTDIDIFIWGLGGSYSIDKTGRVVGDSAYLPDNPLETFNNETGFGYSYTRVDGSEGFQTPSGSNGVMGRDETSENWTQTFQIQPSNPSPGAPLYPVEGAWQDIWFHDGAQGAHANHAWGDLSRDGVDDLYLVNSLEGVGNQLFNHQSGDQFEENTPYGLGSFDTDQVAVWADLFNDGDLDLFVGRSPGQNVCFSNLYDYHWDNYFLELSDGGMQENNQSIAAAWVDFDNDGLLEVFVANEASPAQLLFTQYGFFDLTPEDLIFPDGCRNFAWCDFDVDMDPDLSVITAGGQVYILTNDGEGQFTRVTHEVTSGGTNCAWGDFDNDGDFDLLVTMTNQPNLLFQNEGPAGFQVNQLPAAGEPLDSREAVWGDYDNDGFLDIYVANHGAANLLLHNDGGTGIFVSVSDDDVSSLVDCVATSWNDVDQDGDVDLFLSGLPNNQLLRNNSDNGNHYLAIRLAGHQLGHQSNISAIGALIKVTATGQTQWRHVPGDGSTMVQFFGLGDAMMVDEIVVYWPYKMLSGQIHTSRLLDVEVDGRLEISEPMLGLSGTMDDQLPSSFALLPCRPNPFNPLTTISFDVPRTGVVDLEVFDVAGRKVRTLHLGETFEAGRHAVVWNGTDDHGRSLASGVYHIRLKAKQYEGGQRVTLIK